MKGRQIGDYYLGLDIGTDSVGWAVTDKEYNILNFGRKAMWGIHLFDAGNTAEERRMHRCTRRRLDRRNQRLALLRELFAVEIAKIDPAFYYRLEESKFYLEDRTDKQPNTLFNDKGFTDKDYHKRFPTIYHLRKYLMETKEKPDVRLIYLAAHHIIKNRGHFLFETNSTNFDYGDIIPKFVEALNDELGMDISIDNITNEIGTVLEDRNLGVREKESKLNKLFDFDDSRGKAVSKLLSGGKVSLDKIFEDDETLEKKSVCFKNPSIDDELIEIEDILGERFQIIEHAKRIYDIAVLQKLLYGSATFSDAKIKQYTQHQKDLKALKLAVRKLSEIELDKDKKLYKLMFKDKGDLKNYQNYIETPVKCSQDDFCKFVKKFFEGTEILSEDIQRRLDDSSFMPKLKSKDNGIIPNSLHVLELGKIIENTKVHYPFLESKDESGITIGEKIVMLCSFKIPYYVGPLDDRSDKSWIVRRSFEKVRPWNYEKIVDIERTSEGFINNLISVCGFITGEKVIPKNSLLYSRFTLYNEINKIRLNGEPFTPSQKKELVSELFLKRTTERITKKTISEFFVQRTGCKDIEITGIDNEIKSKLKSEIKMKELLGDEKFRNRRLMEDIILTITIYSDERKRLKQVLEKKFGNDLNKDEIEKLSAIKYDGWGRYSEFFLTGIYANVEGAEMNIITALELTNNNLMELLSKKYDFIRKINEVNNERCGVINKKMDYDALISDLYCSPAVKRGIWRTMRIIDDIVHATGHAPSKIFVETTRNEGVKKRTVSRKNDLLEKYAIACKNDPLLQDLVSSLEGTEESSLRGRRLYLFYTQAGRCMYCGKQIDPNDLVNVYDKDHIYPQSKTTDDSLHNNMVLCCKTCNREKLDRYPIEPEIQEKMHNHWVYLRKVGLINEEKFNRLTRKTGFTEIELDKFINRQLVETSQSVKAVTKALEKLFGEESDIVYVKAETVSKFRKQFEFVKCRSVNDYHHAKDAYLNIVVGNTYDTKFTKNPLVNIIKKNDQYSFNKLFDHDVSRNDVNAWIAGEDGSIKTVKMYMRRNNILFTRYSYMKKGQLYDLTIMPKNKGQLPIKTSDKRMSIEKYGGYSDLKGSYYSLIEYIDKNKKVRSIEAIPLIISGLGEEKIIEYLVSSGLNEPKIRIAVIKTNAKIRINGFDTFITGRTGNSILLAVGEQLVLSDELYAYCKKIDKYIEECKSTKIEKKAEDYGIVSDKNIELYDLLIGKLDGLYGKAPSLPSQKETLVNLRDKFTLANVSIQSKVLGSILNMFRCNSGGMDLKLIGGPGLAGRILVSKKIQCNQKIEIINESPSGLFESKPVDLSRV